MSILKFKKTDDQGNEKDWVVLYGEVIKNRVRVDLNLADLSDKEQARINLGIYGNENTTHYHDDRYPQKSYVENKFNSIENSVKEMKFTIVGKCTSNEITLNPNASVDVNINSVKADTINVTPVTGDNRYLALVDGVGGQEVHNIDGFYVNCSEKRLYATSIGSVNIECSGDIRASRVFNAVWNDYAELMPRGEETEPGDIIMLDLKAKDERYIKATDKLGTVVAGVHSDEFGMLIGGEKPVDGKDLLEYNIDKYIPVALSGRVHVNFIGKAKKGAKVVPSSEPGYGRLYNKGVDDPDTIIGYLVEDDDKTNKRKLRIRITR